MAYVYLFWAILGVLGFSVLTEFPFVIVIGFILFPFIYYYRTTRKKRLEIEKLKSTGFVVDKSFELPCGQSIHVDEHGKRMALIDGYENPVCEFDQDLRVAIVSKTIVNSGATGFVSFDITYRSRFSSMRLKSSFSQIPASRFADFSQWWKSIDGL